MWKAMAGTMTVLTMLLNGSIAFAGKNEGRQYPRTKCNKQLVRDIYDNENSELMDAIRKYYQEGEKHGWTDEQFCGWLRKRYDGQIEARFGECLTCQQPEPETVNVDDHRDVVRHVVRERPAPPPPEEEPAPRESRHDNGGSFLSSPFMGGLLGGALGGFLGVMLGNRMNQQQQPMFPPPYWGGGMPGMPGMPGMRPPGVLPYPGGGAPGVLPLAGQSPYALPYGQTNPWAMPYGGQYGGAYGYNNYGFTGGAYRGPAPGVLPLAPQSTYSNFSVMGSIPQNHWNLINVGR
jgi:hypothetical protein